MIERIIALSVRHRWWVIAGAILLALFGSYAALDTPIDAIPDLSENQVIVFTDWLGHSPQEIEDQITHPLSLALQGVQDVRVVRTSSDVNFSMIHVVFTEAVDVATARRRVDEHVSRAAISLPPSVTPRLAPEAPATGQILWYTLEGTGLDLGAMRGLQDWYVGPQLASVEGVAEVAGVGGYAIEYHVEVDPQRLLANHGSLSHILTTLQRANYTVGGHVIAKAGQEYVVQTDARLGVGADGHFTAQRATMDLECLLFPKDNGSASRLGEVARVSVGPAPRRGVFEKDGNEVVGGVVMMRYGANPVEIVDRVREKIERLQVGLPRGVRIVVGYERTPLIRAAVKTVRRALLEAILTASICVVLVMRHFRSSLVIAVTLPLATLVPFVLMWGLRYLGLAQIDTNIMSLAGLTISIGVLVDSSIVMTENVVHQLQQRFGSSPVSGDVREHVVRACQTVGRPIFFSVLIMLLSFLPVFGLTGLEGKMFRPLAFTKSFAALAVAGLAITLVPLLCSLLVRGRLRSEQESWLVRSLTEVYRPLLSFFLDRPAAMLWVMGVTFILGVAPLGSSWWMRAILAAGLVACGLASRTNRGRVLAISSLVGIAILASFMSPVGSEFLTPLDEGVVMDMPITIPRISISQAGDDLKARDMMLCRFPEVDMVMGKVGRADTPTDPAPIDMIETMVMLRPREFWPTRKLADADARSLVYRVLDELVTTGVVDRPTDVTAVHTLVDNCVSHQLPRFDALMREYGYHRNREFTRELAASEVAPPRDPYRTYHSLWKAHTRRLNSEYVLRAGATWTHLVLAELLQQLPIKREEVATAFAKLRKYRLKGTATQAVPAQAAPAQAKSDRHHSTLPPPDVDPIPVVDSLQQQLAAEFSEQLVLWRVRREDLGSFGGEMDLAVQMPGWVNVWTRPIQNRVDMLNTGVDSLVGVRVLGQSQQDVVEVSEQIALALKEIRGATNVIADPVRGKAYLQVRIDRERAAELKVNVADAQDIVEVASGGKVVGSLAAGRERHAIRVRYPRMWREDEQSLRRIPIPVYQRPFLAEGVTNVAQVDVGESDGSVPLTSPTRRAREESSLALNYAWPPSTSTVALEQVATINTREGPAAIKGENGLLRNYVRLDVRDRDALDFVAEAKQVIAEQVSLPPGVYLEWTGRFEHWQHYKQTLSVVAPLVLLLIFVLLWATYHDLADAFLMMLAVPGALAGGLLFQWLLGFKLSITVTMGYVACFGMATATGVIMLVYLRQAIDQAGGLVNMSLAQVREAVLSGAVNRLRPKLLTEATTIIGLAPMLWADGVGAEIIRPMAAPVLGGILVADEVIDLFLPVLFYWVRRRRWHRLHTAAGEPRSSL